MKRLFVRLIRLDQRIDQKIQTLPFGISVPFFTCISKEFSFILAFLIPLIGAWVDHAVLWGSVWLAGVVAYLTTKRLKRWTGRRRPQEKTRSSIHLDQEAGSFPSRHVAVLAAEGMVLLLAGSQLASSWFLFVFLVAFARLGLREHFFTDVVFGLIWGLLNGWLIELIKGVVTA